MGLLPGCEILRLLQDGSLGDEKSTVIIVKVDLNLFSLI